MKERWRIVTQEQQAAHLAASSCSLHYTHTHQNYTILFTPLISWNLQFTFIVVEDAMKHSSSNTVLEIVKTFSKCMFHNAEHIAFPAYLYVLSAHFCWSFEATMHDSFAVSLLLAQLIRIVENFPNSYISHQWSSIRKGTALGTCNTRVVEKGSTHVMLYRPHFLEVRPLFASHWPTPSELPKACFCQNWTFANYL